MNKIYFGYIIKKTNQKGGKYYLLNVWCPASYNGIENQKDEFYYIVDEEVFNKFKDLKMDSDISNLVNIELTQNSTKIIIDNKKYNER